MTLTTFGRFLDWYTGGQITEAEKAIEEAGEWKVACMEATTELAVCNMRLSISRFDASEAKISLRAIIERGNTASPNSTVKAMVQLAKEGLGEADGV